GVQRFRPGYGQHYGAQNDKRVNPVESEEIQRIPGICGAQDAGLAEDLHSTKCGDDNEPDERDGAEDSPDFGGPLFLKKEEREDDHQCERYGEFREEWLD